MQKERKLKKFSYEKFLQNDECLEHSVFTREVDLFFVATYHSKRDCCEKLHIAQERQCLQT
jgi:hypothetical protein